MTVVSLILVVAGFLGSSFGGPDWLIVLAFLGLFAPFLLRELGVMRWRDDFQREAVMRSGMHALAAVGVLLTVIVILQGTGGTALNAIERADDYPAGVIFLLMAITWGLSWLLQFWGARTGAFRILLWTLATTTTATIAALIYVAAIGQPQSWHGIWTAGLQLVIGWALVLLCRRWPRVTGVLVLATVAWMVWTLRTTLAGHPAMILALIIVGLPFLVPGVALIFSRSDPAEA